MLAQKKAKILRQISLTTCFNLIDVNGDGILSKKEIIRAITLNRSVQDQLRKLHNKSNALHPSRIRGAIQRMDSNNDGLIYLDEWVNYMDQLADDEQYDEFKQKLQQQDKTEDALPNIAGLSALKQWIRSSGRRTRLACKFERERLLRRGLEAFCEVGWGTSIDGLELVALHLEQIRLKRLIQEAEIVRAQPNILRYYEQERKETQNHAKEIFKAWKIMVHDIIAGVPGSDVSISYWRKYQRSFEKNRLLEERVLAVLSDDLTQIPIKEGVSISSFNDRRNAMSLSLLTTPTLLSSSSSRRTTALMPVTLRRRMQGNVPENPTMLKSVSLPTLRASAGVGGLTKNSTTRAWRKRIGLPNEVTLVSLRPEEPNVPMVTMMLKTSNSVEQDENK